MFRQSKILIISALYSFEAVHDEKDLHSVSKQKFIKMTFIGAKLPLKVVLPTISFIIF